MKKNGIIFLWVFIITVTTLFSMGIGGNGEQAQVNTQEYVRIHIRADSNEAEAQAVKYLVRDAVVAYLTPVVVQYNDAQSAQQDLQQRLPAIERVANGVLRENGFLYGARASLRKETFPTRAYGEFVLPYGEYFSLIIELGSGQGDNWWCVAYPPLCFTATQNVVYKSKILEIIQRWKNG